MSFRTIPLFGMPTLSPEEVKGRLPHSDFYVFDNNPERVYQMHHLPGAIHLDPTLYSVSSLPSDRGATLVFYSSGPLCGAAPHAARKAGSLGYPRVFVMAAGLTGWMDRGFPTEKGE